MKKWYYNVLDDKFERLDVSEAGYIHHEGKVRVSAEEMWSDEPGRNNEKNETASRL